MASMNASHMNRVQPQRMQQQSPYGQGPQELPLRRSGVSPLLVVAIAVLALILGAVLGMFFLRNLISLPQSTIPSPRRSTRATASSPTRSPRRASR